MQMSLENWIAIAGVVVMLVVGVGGWFFLRPKPGQSQVQKQSTKGGIAIQSGRDTNIGDK